MSTDRTLTERLLAGDTRALARAISLIENETPDGAELVGKIYAKTGNAYLIGVTGPPGAGKSSLLGELVAAWRRAGRTVAVLAVDPTSRRSGGALLGDRARIPSEPGDRGVFIRSTAAGERLGGLAPATRAAAQALAAAFDVVVIETVGVGQSETEVADVADTVVVVVQPGSGDVLQFLKAGIMEIPDLLVVTKADLGVVAQRARRDLLAAVRALGSEAEVVMVSSVAPAQGFDELVAALGRRREQLDLPSRRTHARRRAALADFVAEHGDRGLRALGGRRAAEKWLDEQEPGLDVPALERRLEQRALEAL